MNKRTKALSISPEVKRNVWERDDHRCINCGSPHAFPEAHFISRSHGGLGIEQNILTLCRDCHNAFDFGSYRDVMKIHFRDYLQSKYPDWDESKLTYKKGI